MAEGVILANVNPQELFKKKLIPPAGPVAIPQSPPSKDLGTNITAVLQAPITIPAQSAPPATLPQPASAGPQIMTDVQAIALISTNPRAYNEKQGLEAVDVLTRSPHPDALKTLAAAAQIKTADEPIFVAIRAAGYLANVGNAQADQYVKELLLSSSQAQPNAQWQAAAGIAERIFAGDKAAMKLADETVTAIPTAAVRREFIKFLARERSGAIMIAAKGLYDSTPEVCDTTIEVLKGYLNHHVGLVFVFDDFVTNKKAKSDSQLRLKAIKALGESDPNLKKYMTALISRLPDDNDKFMLSEALRQYCSAKQN